MEIVKKENLLRGEGRVFSLRKALFDAHASQA